MNARALCRCFIGCGPCGGYFVGLLKIPSFFGDRHGFIKLIDALMRCRLSEEMVCYYSPGSFQRVCSEFVHLEENENREYFNKQSGIQ